MNTISAVLHRSKYAEAAHAVLAVDGVPIEQWIKTGVRDDDGDDTAAGLVPAQGWLLDEDCFETAWKLIELPAESATVVPLLVCPDDLDLDCTVVVVEQMTEGNSVVWKRFGLATDHVKGVITSVCWQSTEQRAIFERRQFIGALNEFKRLSQEV